jgi:hypothetical protein
MAKVTHGSRHTSYNRRDLAITDAIWREALFPAERAVPDRAKTYGVQVQLDEMQLHRPRQWGAAMAQTTHMMHLFVGISKRFTRALD